MREKRKRISWLSAIAVVLIACVISALPLSASAAEETPPPAVSSSLPHLHRLLLP